MEKALSRSGGAMKKSSLAGLLFGGDPDGAAYVRQEYRDFTSFVKAHGTKFSLTDDGVVDTQSSFVAG